MNVTQQGQLAGLLGGGVAGPANTIAPPNLISADGALPLASATYVVNKGSAAALTIAAPGASDVGTQLTITSDSAFAHAITFTGNTLRGGTAAVATATFAAQKGAGITIACVVSGEWHVLANIAATLA